MSKIVFTLAAIMTLAPPLSAQSSAAHVSSSREVGGPLPFAIPSLHVGPTALRAAPGRRLYVVMIELGEEPIETEVRRFLLVTSGGTLEPIGAGASGELIIPFDRLPDRQEVGVILPSDAIVALTRQSATSVVLEVGPRGAVALLYELPEAASVRSLRLPGGRELAMP